MASKKKPSAASKPKKRRSYDWQRALAELGWKSESSAFSDRGPTWVSPSGQVSAFMGSSQTSVVATVVNADPRIGVNGCWYHTPDRDLIRKLEELEERFTTQQEHTVFVDVGVRQRLTVTTPQRLALTVDCIGAEQARAVVEQALQDLIDGRYATKEHVDDSLHNLRYDMEHPGARD